ncbi:hypothetical protein B0H66DRAFT_543264 [Apodospora peruviana]|uniref:Uncharacterized protein n=1 Tax=Apodospora peruviana TaxID=516989 RepID=A0AAE0MFE7_9PEZI|nr:hypothetical protein B0H66DRAFT_543264 [Apodospora peruviana]
MGPPAHLPTCLQALALLPGQGLSAIRRDGARRSQLGRRRRRRYHQAHSRLMQCQSAAGCRRRPVAARPPPWTP